MNRTTNVRYSAGAYRVSAHKQLWTSCLFQKLLGVDISAPVPGNDCDLYMRFSRHFVCCGNLLLEEDYRDIRHASSFPCKL